MTHSLDSPIEYDTIPDRAFHRITALYSIDSAVAVANEFGVEFASRGDSLTTHLSFDRLDSCYQTAGRQFPRVLYRGEMHSNAVDLPGISDDSMRTARMWILCLPHGALVLALTIELACPVALCIPVMEALHHKRFAIEGRTPWEAFQAALPDDIVPLVDKCVFGVNVHQLLYVSGDGTSHVVDPATGTPNRVAIAELIYRYQGNYSDTRLERSRIQYPPEANRGLESVAATGPYVAVIAGQQGYVENAFFISAVQMLAAGSLLRRIRIEVYDELLRFRKLSDPRTAPPKMLRTQLAVMSRRLGHLELELSFGVEAFETIGSLVPSLRVIDYHRAVFCAADMPDEAKTTATMLARLSHAIQSDLEVVRATERLADERRRLLGSVLIGLVTLVALPLGIVFGFFGINTTDVQSGASLLDIAEYKVLYALVFGVMFATIVTGVMLRLSFRLADNRAALERASIEDLQLDT